MSNKYFLPRSCLERINSASLDGSFLDVYLRFLEIFMGGQDYSRKDKGNTICKSAEKGTRLLVVDKNNNPVYRGRLWNDERINYIGPSDYIFTVPAWDWWIEPLLPRKEYCSRRLEFIISNEITSSDLSDIKKLLAEEGYPLVREKFLGCNCDELPKEIRNFREMIATILPLKLSYDTLRIRKVLAEDHYDDIFFILRGGRFIRDLLNGTSDMSRWKLIGGKHSKDTPKYSGDACLIIDDCIGTGRTLESLLGTLNYGKISFACLDATLPLEIYQRRFGGIEFFLPDSLLNIYGCRLFEENPIMAGVESVGGEQEESYPLVRQRLLEKIKLTMRQLSERELKETIGAGLNKMEIEDYDK
ncbi:MAG: hypothetical protein AB1571_04095 [Nanoarchaeota archaeon]